VRLVPDRAEERERGLGIRPDEQEERPTVGRAIEVATARRARDARGGLRLPVEQHRADRIVVIACRRGERLARLVEGDEQEFALLVLELEDAALEVDVLVAGLDVANGRGDLAARVVAMQRERPLRDGQDLVGEPDAVVEHLA